MIRKVLALDIGRYSCKGVILEISRKHIRILDFKEVLNSSCTEEGASPLAAWPLWQEDPEIQMTRPYDSLYFGLGAQHASFRRFVFRKARLRNIRRFIENELEDSSLLDTQNYLLDYVVLDKKADPMDVVAILSSKEAIAKTLREFSSSLVMPTIFDVENMALLNTIPFLKPCAGPTLVVDGGHEKVSLTLLKSHKLVHSALIPRDPAGSLALIQEDVLRTLKTWQAADPSCAVEQLVCIGGLAKDKAWNAWIHDAVGCPEKGEELVGLESAVPLPDNFYSTYFHALSLGLRSVYHKTNSRLNLRRGEFAIDESYHQLAKRLITGVKVTAAVLGTLFALTILKSTIYNNKMKEIQKNYKQQITTLLKGEPPELRRINWDQNFGQYSQLSQEIITSRFTERTGFVTLMTNPPWVLVVLEKLSQALPKKLTFEIADLQINHKEVLISATVPTKQDAKKAMELIAQTSFFASPQKISETLTSDGKIQISFKALLER